MIQSQASLTVESAAVLARYVIPVYTSLPSASKMLLFTIFEESFLLLGHVLNFIKLLQKSSEAKIYKRFLIEGLSHNHGCIYKYIRGAEHITELQMLRSAFFGSKILNSVGDEIDIENYLDIVRAQFKFIFDQTPQFEDKVYADFLCAFISLHSLLAPEVVFGGLVLSSEDHFSKFVQILRCASLLSQKKLVKALIFFLDSRVSQANTDSAFNIFQRVGVELLSTDILLKVHNEILSAVLVRNLTEEQALKLYHSLLVFFHRHEAESDGTACFLLCLALQRLPHSVKAELGHAEEFLNAVTFRLTSQDAAIRERTMYIAKKITNDSFEYESDFTIETPHIKTPKSSIIDFSTLQAVKPLHDHERNFKPSASLDNTMVRLSLSESETDENGVTLVFLKDLIREFELLSNQTASRLHLLKSTVRLIRQKKDFTLEISTYSPQLLAVITSLANNLEEPAFEEWRINALVSILFAAPEKVIELIKILFGQELSLQQRMSILSALSLAARELRGIDDSVIMKLQVDFPTKRLPWDKGKPEGMKNDKLSASVPTSKSLLQENKTTWKSKKLTTSAKDILSENRFRKVAAKFFFPLAHGWLNGINMGTYDLMFKKHYLTTMQMVLSAAYPHHEFNSMCQQMAIIVQDAIDQGVEVDELGLAKLSELAV